MAVELSETERELISEICANFGQWAPEESQAPKFKGIMAGGTSNRCLLLAGRDQRWVLRIANSTDRQGVCRRRELAAHTAAAAADLAPNICWADERRGALIMDYIADAATLPEATSGSMLNEQQALYVRQLSTLFHGIHALPISGEPLDLQATLSNYLQNLDAPMTQESPLHHSHNHAAALDWALDVVNKRRDQPTVLCHNDLLMANRRRQQNRLLALDWEYAAPADPLFDLAVCASELTDSLATYLLITYLGRQASVDEIQEFAAFGVLYACLAYCWYRTHSPHDSGRQRAAARLSAVLERHRGQF